MSAGVPYFLNFPESFGKDVIGMLEKAIRKRSNIQLAGLSGNGKTFIFKSMLAKNGDYYGIEDNLISKLEEFEQRGKIGVVLVDMVDEEKLKMIMPLYDKYRNYVVFVFFVKKEVLMKSSCEVIYIKPWSEKDIDWFVRGLIEKNEVKVDDVVIDRIVKASGGVLGIIKRLFELVVAGEDLDGMIENPRKYPKLAYQLELMEIENKDEWLKKYYLMDDRGNFLSKVVENYLKIKGSGRGYLTREENKAMKFLEKNRGRIVEREELIVAIWGTNATKGIADHALDQLIHRLREKIKKDGLVVETVRGRGHVLR